MQNIWFVRTRWFWWPVHRYGWLLAAAQFGLMLALNVWIWLSAQETVANLQLLMLLLSNSIGFLWFDWLARRCSYRDGRRLYRHQADAESWT